MYLIIYDFAYESMGKTINIARMIVQAEFFHHTCAFVLAKILQDGFNLS